MKKRQPTPNPDDPTRTAIPLELVVPEPFVVEWANLPDWAHWVAVDANGDVWAYHEEPIINPETGDHWEPSAFTTNGDDDVATQIGRIGYAVANWKSTATPAPGYKSARTAE